MIDVEEDENDINFDYDLNEDKPSSEAPLQGSSRAQSKDKDEDDCMDTFCWHLWKMIQFFLFLAVFIVAVAGCWVLTVYLVIGAPTKPFIKPNQSKTEPTTSASASTATSATVEHEVLPTSTSSPWTESDKSAITTVKHTHQMPITPELEKAAIKSSSKWEEPATEKALALSDVVRKIDGIEYHMGKPQLAAESIMSQKTHGTCEAAPAK